jgi:phosphoserine phosphatase RsbU/P
VDEIGTDDGPERAWVNCWELKRCGREPGGAKVGELGVCPAASEALFDGFFHGRNSGRACWVVAGTFCKGEIQGIFAQKYRDCRKCDFFRLVQKEEGPTFRSVNVLMSYIDKTHEQRVDERIHELQEAKAALEAANKKLADVNTDLAWANYIASRDIDMAARIQASFFPKTAPESEEWDVAFEFTPLSGVSGDLYDFYQSDGTLDGVSLFDVSGHGIAPGLITLLARSVIFHQFAAGGNKPLNEVIESVNRDLIGEIEVIENYLTGILLRFRGSMVEYVNAGHPDLLFRKAATGKVQKVEARGPDFKGNFLGVAELEDKFEIMFLKMAKDDAVLLYSDGLSESRNAREEEFGTERIVASLESASSGMSARGILDHVLGEFRTFIGGNRLKDDMTLILVKRRIDEEPSLNYAP